MEDQFGKGINAFLAESKGLSAADVVDFLFAGIKKGDHYIFAANDSQGGPAAMENAVRMRMEAQMSRKALSCRGAIKSGSPCTTVINGSHTSISGQASPGSLPVACPKLPASYPEIPSVCRHRPMIQKLWSSFVF